MAQNFGIPRTATLRGKRRGAVAVEGIERRTQRCGALEGHAAAEKVAGAADARGT